MPQSPREKDQVITWFIEVIREIIQGDIVSEEAAILTEFSSYHCAVVRT